MISSLFILFAIFATVTYSLDSSSNALRRYRSNKLRMIIKRSSLLCSIAIFDNVLDKSLCEIIDNGVKVGGLGHTVFLRDSPPRTAAEVAIHSILTTMNDFSPIIEYWWREEWLNLELHRDIDEKLAQQLGSEIFRYPNHAHVLYLSVGDLVEGPTIVLHDSSNINPISQFENITIVPAVNGRLLRFDGKLMHSTPRPALSYLDPSEGGSNLELWTRKRPVDKNDPEFSVLRRSVLLFNTWSDKPPTDISTQPSIGSISAHQQQQEVNINENEKIKNILSNLVWIKRPLDSSVPEKFNSEERSADSKERRIRLKIGILGDIRRRERSDRYLNLYTSSVIKEALIDEEKLPTRFDVSETL